MRTVLPAAVPDVLGTILPAHTGAPGAGGSSCRAAGAMGTPEGVASSQKAGTSVFRTGFFLNYFFPVKLTIIMHLID